jgi:hypothetical protein
VKLTEATPAQGTAGWLKPLVTQQGTRIGIGNKSRGQLKPEGVALHQKRQIKMYGGGSGGRRYKSPSWNYWSLRECAAGGTGLRREPMPKMRCNNSSQGWSLLYKHYT